ncbi:apoptosis-stimulating of p53 protein 1 isoform X3 [Harmonia axyridis]|uniref:apoptosis-stimulating of p53 protein 1 isoform X3 n=1 Tax=Harmonia axyridis TaxID=115357 RepID=UPI001E278437|nr:apoptosis-stimulating of p53 protein 1 isoform X3 [Harmonia axyridis]
MMVVTSNQTTVGGEKEEKSNVKVPSLVNALKNECTLQEADHPLEILQRWGSGRLMLRYTLLSKNGGAYEKRNGMKEPDHIGCETLPDGVQLTLSELREMACRQQSQIDSQHQLLAAKEQRLRYLKEQEARQQRVQAESERLRRLRDRVDAQELKLRKLRALRGQVDHQKQNNLSLTSDLDSIRALFNEKEKELSLAVAKVEELTRQLEELKRGRSSRDQPPASALELDKLRRELMYRNKLNEQQNHRLNQQREALTARQEEMSAIDKRISELQERLHRKRMLNQQLANQISAASHKAAYHQLVRLTGNADQSNQAFSRKQQQNMQQPSNGLSRGNIAAVEPYNHVPLQTGQPLRENKMQENTPYHPGYHQQPIKKESDLQNAYENQDMACKMGNNLIPNRPEDIENFKEFAVSKSDPKYQTLPYNTKFTVNLLSSRSGNVNNNNNKLDNNELKHIDKESEQPSISTGAGMHNGNVNFSQPTAHMTVHSAPLNILNKNMATPLNHNDLILSRRNSSEQGSVKEHGHQKMPDPILYNNIASTPPNINYQKPISSVAPTSVHHTGILSNVYQTSSIKVQPVEPQTTLSSNKQVPSPANGRSSNNTSGVSLILSPPQSSSTPYNSTPEVSIEKIPKPALPPKPAIKPPPRQTQHVPLPTEDSGAQPPPLPSSDPPEDVKPITVPQRVVLPPPLQPSRAGGREVTIEKLPLGLTPTSTIQSYHQSSSEMIIKAKPLTIKKQQFTEQPKLRSVSGYKVNSSASRRIEMPPSFQYQATEKPLDSPSSTDSREKDNTERDEVDKAATTEDHLEPNRSPDKDEKPIDGVIRRCKKGNLKQSGKQNLSRRVSFDPLALLLDASLEGELELVKKTASQVANPSAANDEGITALHNAICAGHLEIVKFLVEFGCDVNAQDSDGWTPLHCGASCNNVAMVKFLVEHGACIFATTLSDHETAAEKCEEDEEGFDGCSEYLYSVQEKLGILSNGAVYAVFDYTAQQPDELSFKSGQQLTVLRKGDENEREWWWCRLGDKEGYVPRNLLGLYPRVIRSEE